MTCRRHAAPIGGLIGGLGLLLLAIAGLSCKTSRTPGAAAAPESQPPEFVPATYIVPIRVEAGDYPSLFSPDSYAVWAGPDVAALRRAKAVENGESIDPKLDAAVARINDNYLVFECHLYSAFSDMSIGYDAVGFRGITVFLETPDGRKINPIQAATGTSASEEQQQALKKFGRTNLLLFQKRDVWAGGDATVAPQTPAVRLVLQGYGSTFAFQWDSSAPPSTSWQATQEETVRVLKVGFNQFYGSLLEVMHIFD